MKAAIIVLEWPGSRPCSAPSRMALGTYSQALPCCNRVTKSDMGRLQVFGDGLELADGVVGTLGALAHGVFKAMIDVVVHQGLLGVADGALDRLQLLGDVEAAAPLLQHGD